MKEPIKIVNLSELLMIILDRPKLNLCFKISFPKKQIILSYKYLFHPFGEILECGDPG